MSNHQEYGELKPKSQDCSICLEKVDADDVMSNGMSNCVSCKNGHFIHRKCYDKMTTKNCPICREEVRFNCKGSSGYIQLKRKGGKKRKTIRKRMSRSKRMSKRKTFKK